MLHRLISVMDTSLDWMRIWTFLLQIGFGAQTFKQRVHGNLAFYAFCRLLLAQLGAQVYPGWWALETVWSSSNPKRLPVQEALVV